MKSVKTIPTAPCPWGFEIPKPSTYFDVVPRHLSEFLQRKPTANSVYLFFFQRHIDLCLMLPRTTEKIVRQVREYEIEKHKGEAPTTVMMAMAGENSGGVGSDGA